MAGSGTTVLVTGGAGYVGSHCLVELLNEGYGVVVLDNFINSIESENARPESINRVESITGKSVIFCKVDLLDKEALRQIFIKNTIDCVLHFAALKAVGESCQIPLRYYSNNICGTTNLLEVMVEHNVKRFLFSSSSTVYGDPQYLPVDEKHPTGGCTNPYGKTKFFIEEVLKDVCAANPKWGCVLLRYFNPVGAHPSGIIGEDPQGVPNGLMPYISQVAVGRREKLKVFGKDYDTPDGTGVRDYIHVADLATGHVAALKHLLKPTFRGCAPYNLGTGRGFSVLEVVKEFEKASGKQVPYEIVEKRAGDIASTYATCDLAKKELDWEAKYSLFDMCKDAWAWQSKNPMGYLK